MNLIKYGIYIIAILIIALLFEQIMTLIYDLSLNASSGDLNAIFALSLIWGGISIVVRVVVNKRKHPDASRFVLWGAMGHIGACVAIFCYKTDPLYLLGFPIVIGLLYRIKNSKNFAKRYRSSTKFRRISPFFIDDRSGICTLRSGAHYTGLKFFDFHRQFPVKEFLLYLFHEQIESVVEIRQMGDNKTNQLITLFRGRNYDAIHTECLTKINHLKQFFRQEKIEFCDINDTLNSIRSFYHPYFLYLPSPLNEEGDPVNFPKISIDENEIIIEQDYDEYILSISAIHPDFTANQLYKFLETIEENYLLQLHFRPLSSDEIVERTKQIHNEYCDSLRRLTKGLDENSEFQAATYLFSSVGLNSKENIEPLLNQEELYYLKEVKRKMQQTKTGQEIGMWAVEIYLIGSPVLAQTIALKLNGKQQTIVPQLFPLLVSRDFIGNTQIITSKELSELLPNQLTIDEIISIE